MASTHPHGDHPSPRVLIVEDEPLIAMATGQMLRGAGFSVVGMASTGADALAQFERLADAGTPPDAVLMDIRLRGPMNGLEAAERLRDRHPRLTIIFVSASLDSLADAQAERAGADAALAKPFADHTLLAALQASLARRAAPAMSNA